MILTGNANRALAARVAVELGLELGNTKISTLADGETSVCIDEPLLGVDTYIVQSLSPPANQHLLEALLLADACYRGGAMRITLVAPYLAYSRQERVSQPGRPIATQLLAAMLAAAKINRVVTLDFHNLASVGLFPMPFYHLTAASLYQPLFKDFDNLVVIAPDYGGKQRAQTLATLLGCDYLSIDKRSNQQEYLAVNKSLPLRGCDCLLYDDMCVSGRTLLWAQELLRQRGVRSISIAVTHALFSDAVATKLVAQPLRLFVCSDSVAHSATSPSTHTLPIAGRLATAITALHSMGTLPVGAHA
ncbi:MAG: ribose-phosphate diphosphokinase [Pseudomonadota bacterium]|nr:ribose-phosphate diphosphokinase [Pseudomonadota bacterium]